MIGRYLNRVADSTGEARYAEAAGRFLDSGRLWSNLGFALLTAGAVTARGDLKALVDAVADTARSAMDVERRALTALTPL
jgi:hypothetical protein